LSEVIFTSVRMPRSKLSWSMARSAPSKHPFRPPLMLSVPIFIFGSCGVVFWVAWWRKHCWCVCVVGGSGGSGGSGGGSVSVVVVGGGGICRGR